MILEALQDEIRERWPHLYIVIIKAELAWQYDSILIVPTVFDFFGLALTILYTNDIATPDSLEGMFDVIDKFFKS